MKFIDFCEVKIRGGKGGNGAVAFRREKFIPHGGPSGGDGGKGGNVLFQADNNLTTLLDLSYRRVVQAQDGEHGKGKDCYGRGGEDFVVRVPVGTQVYDANSRELLFDFVMHGQTEILAKGGKGGRGNIHFATPYDKAPRRAEPGESGEEYDLHLELKVLADVGLIGFPNAGKSTFISACSKARPKVADYPFTTLIPHLGVARVSDEHTLVLADIPGLVEGASQGAGLGYQFLKHIERTHVFLHLITVHPGEQRDPYHDYEIVSAELRSFDPNLAKRRALVALSKADLPYVREVYPALKSRFAEKKIDLKLVSAVTGEGVANILHELHQNLKESHLSQEETPSAPSEPS